MQPAFIILRSKALLTHLAAAVKAGFCSLSKLSLRVKAPAASGKLTGCCSCRYLSYVLYPCVLGYAIYALIYEKHTSWYSFILNSLVGAVYTFGFILMCPQVISAPTLLAKEL